MTPSPASGGSKFMTGASAGGAGDDRRLLIGLTGSPSDESLMRYMAFWAGLHQRDRDGCGSDSLLGKILPAGTTAQGRDLFMTAPGGLQPLPLPGRRQGSAGLLRQARLAGIEALAVGERRVALDLIRAAPCSVWFVPNGSRAVLRRVLVPIDFSVRAADSMRVATSLARLAGAAECVALHVHFNDALLTGSWGERQARREAWAAYEKFMKPIDVLGVKVTPCFREGADVARAINQAARELSADVIVLASRGRSWAASLLQPAIAEQTVRDCEVPLLVVKHFGAARGFLSLLAQRLCTSTSEVRCN